jgi:hypothetical protein
MTAQVRASVTARVDVRTAFDALVDLPSQSRWMVATSLYPLDGAVEVPEVGSRMAAFTAVLGVGVLDEMEVTAFDPPHRWEVKHLGRVIAGSGIFAVSAAPAGSRIEWVEELDLPLGALGRLGWPAVRPAVRWGLQLSLRRLAAGLESGTFPIGRTSA